MTKWSGMGMLLLSFVPSLMLEQSPKGLQRILKAKRLASPSRTNGVLRSSNESGYRRISE